SANVPSDAFSVPIGLQQGSFDLLGCGHLAKMVQHKDSAHEQGGGICQPLSGDVGSSAVNSFKHGAFVANVGAGNYAQTAHQAGGEIAHHITIKIGKQQHVELQKIHHHLHANVIDDQFLVLNFGELGGNRADRAKEQAIGKLHNVGLVDGVN